MAEPGFKSRSALSRGLTPGQLAKALRETPRYWQSQGGLLRGHVPRTERALVAKKGGGKEVDRPGSVRNEMVAGASL